MDVPHPRAEEGHLHLLLSINMIKMIVHRPTLGFPDGSEVKASARNVGNLGSIHGLGRSPGERNGNPLQHSCLENPKDMGAWWAILHGVAKELDTI